KANSGHPGGPMGGADYVHVLFTEFLNYDPDDMAARFRDRFFLDAGHMSPMLYSVQSLLGNFSSEDLQQFRQWGSVTPGHPELDLERGVENTSGPLGLGHAFGIGSAIAERFMVQRFGELVGHKTYIYISDGGVQEEISQAAGRLAGYLGLGNIVMFYDANDIQLSTEVDEVTSEDTAKKYEAWGWHVTTIDGNDHGQIRAAIQAGVKKSERPSLIIGKTVMGKGVKLADGTVYEGKVELHGKALGESKASYEETIKSLGGNPEAPFEVFPEVKALYGEALDRKREWAKEKRAALAAWTQQEPALANKYEFFMSGQLPEIDWAGIQTKANGATRDASGAVLSHLAGQVENMIVASADLSNSDRTDKFLQHTTAFKKGDFSGQFLQAGVSELTMAALMTGMALHGGIKPACGTFFAFSDYMKPAVRVAALMEQSVIFVWTHDAFRVGEDGPTHQPIEHVMSLRAMPNMTVIRPADAAETAVAWQSALEHKTGPTALILSRQGVPNLDHSKYADASGAAKGAYILSDADNPQVLLLATGSEVQIALDAQDKLAAQGVAARVVSMPSWELFAAQDAAYQESVLPKAVTA
ncbi:MAG: transketolase, partial [Phaeodactylibacter sp.]|nr:transketolase [Phaeodactylibacter sp.]